MPQKSITGYRFFFALFKCYIWLLITDRCFPEYMHTINTFSTVNSKFGKDKYLLFTNNNYEYEKINLQVSSGSN